MSGYKAVRVGEAYISVKPQYVDPFTSAVVWRGTVAIPDEGVYLVRVETPLGATADSALCELLELMCLDGFSYGNCLQGSYMWGNLWSTSWLCVNERLASWCYVNADYVRDALAEECAA